MGRPLSVETPAEFTALVNAYFATLEADTVPTVNGLCLALGVCRDTLWEYSKKPEFTDAVKVARMRLEMSWEQRLASANATGTIFWLKNQGWSDRVDTTVTAAVRIEHSGTVALAPSEAYLKLLNGG